METIIKFDDDAPLFATLCYEVVSKGLTFTTDINCFGVNRVTFTITLTGGF